MYQLLHDLISPIVYPIFTVVSKRIIDLHGGRIGVYSDGEGLGSTFFFEIPVVDKGGKVPSLVVDVNSTYSAGRKNDSIRLPEGGGGTSGSKSESLLINILNQRDIVHPASTDSSPNQDRLNRTVTAHNSGGGRDRVYPRQSSERISIVTRRGTTLSRRMSQNGYRTSQGLAWVVDSSVDDPNRNSSVQHAEQKNIVYMPSDDKESEKVLSILLVDDANSNRKMVRRVLNKSLFTPDEAEDGTVAVDKVSEMIARKEDPYDIILMDFMMPKMDGPTATQAIRRLGFTGIIIGVTGNSSPQDLDTFLSSGADLVMPKPLDIDLLVDNIQRTSFICSVFLHTTRRNTL